LREPLAEVTQQRNRKQNENEYDNSQYRFFFYIIIISKSGTNKKEIRKGQKKIEINK
jgi:hypothetical protein